MSDLFVLLLLNIKVFISLVGILNEDDNCPTIPNFDQTDTDNDNVGDVCDNCPFDANTDQSDVDVDLVGDKCDTGFDR